MIQNVHFDILGAPVKVLPDKTFIESYSSIVPDVTQLANYNIGLAATWHWQSQAFVGSVPGSVPLQHQYTKDLLAVTRYMHI